MLIQITKANGRPILINPDQICSVAPVVEWSEAEQRKVVFSLIYTADEASQTVVESMSRIWVLATGRVGAHAPFNDWLPTQPAEETP